MRAPGSVAGCVRAVQHRHVHEHFALPRAQAAGRGWRFWRAIIFAHRGGLTHMRMRALSDSVGATSVDVGPSGVDFSVSGRPPAASEGVGPPSLKTKTSWKTAKISLRERHCAPLTSCGDVCRHQ